MNQKEMITIIKMRGWRLRSTQGWPYTARVWYVTNEQDVAVIAHRASRSIAISWAVALITDDTKRQEELALCERLTAEGYKWRDFP